MQSNDLTINIAENKARELLTIVGAQEIIPTPLTQIVDYLNYGIFGFVPANEETKNISGYVSTKEKKIYVNDHEPVQRQRFTVAHEIGHIILEGEKDYVDYRRADFISPTEMIMDAFAAELLMPAKIFRSACEYFQKNLIEIANYFGVSVYAVRMRVEYLKL